MVDSSSANLVDLFTAAALVINRYMSDCQVRNVLPDMVEVPESSYMDKKVWLLDVLACSLTNVVPVDEKMDSQSK